MLSAKRRIEEGGARLLAAAVDENNYRTVERVRTEPSLKSLQAAGKLRVIGARYDLDTGKVTFNLGAS